MKHATATSERERERAKQKGGNFYYKRISHTYTLIHTTLSGRRRARRGIEEKRHMRK